MTSTDGKTVDEFKTFLRMKGEAETLSEILSGMTEGGGTYEDPSEIYKPDFNPPDGDVYVVRAAELLREMAAKITQLTDLVAKADQPYTPPPATQAALQPQAAEPETNDATFGAILFAFVRMSLVHPTEAQLHQLDRLIAFYGDQKFASQLKLLAHQARTPHVNRDVGRARPLVFSGSEGIGRKESEIQAALHNHEDLKQLAQAALREHDGTDEGFHNWRAANRAFRRKTHPASILALLSELNSCKQTPQAPPAPPVGQAAAEPVEHQTQACGLSYAEINRITEQVFSESRMPNAWERAEFARSIIAAINAKGSTP